MTIYGHAYGCDGWTSTPAGTAIDQQERSLVKMDTVLGGAMPMHAIALGSSLVSSETDWTDPKRVRRRVTGAVRFWGAGQGRSGLCLFCYFR